MTLTFSVSLMPISSSSPHKTLADDHTADKPSLSTKSIVGISLGAVLMCVFVLGIVLNIYRRIFRRNNDYHVTLNNFVVGAS